MAQLNDLLVTGNSRFVNTIHGTTENSEKLNGQELTSAYSATGTAPVTGTAVASALGTLDGTVSGSAAASKTLTAFSQTDGKVSATFGNISITKSQVSDFPSSMTPSSHTHGNIQNGGTLQTSDITIASGDKLVVTDSSDSSKVARTSVSFDGSTATKCLTQKGTWESFSNNAGTVTSVKVGTTSYSPSSGVVSLPAYPTTLPASDTTSTYSSTGTAPVNGTAVASAIGGLDVTGASSIGAGKTISAWSETDGKVSISTQDISITKSQVSDFPSSMTPSSHTHGNLQNGGTLQTNDITIASGDKLVVTDSSDSSKVARTSISFDGSTTTKCLTQKGTWETFGTSNLAIGTTATTAAAGNHTHTYAGSSTSGGAATSAAKLTNTTKVGDTNKPVYFTASGVPEAISYTIDKSVPSTAVFTDTDTKVTSSANHYTPATATGSDVSASAEGATAAWSIDVVKGVTLNTDGKGHVTGMSVTSGKIPANPNTNTIPSAYCTTPAATAAKKASCTDYVLTPNTWCHVLINTANSYSTGGLTLSINGKTAKNIFINGTASSSSNYTLPAGTYLVYYNGTNYYFRTDGKLLPETTVGSASGWSAGAKPSLSYTSRSIPNVTGVGSVPSLSYESVSIPNVTSAGSASSMTKSNVTSTYISSWTTNTPTAVTLPTFTVSGTQLQITAGSVTAGTAASLSKSDKTSTYISAWSAGSAPTLGTAISASSITAWNAGSTPTLGTAISADDITAWSDGTLPSLTVTDKTVTQNY